MEGAPAVLGEKKVRQLQDLFRKADVDRSGDIDEMQLKTIFRWLGKFPSAAEVQEMFRIADKDQSGAIDFPEFLALMVSKSSKDNLEDVIAETFRIFDRDGNGFINKDELRHMMRNIGEDVTEQELELIIEEVDADGDGLINYQEYISMVTC